MTAPLLLILAYIIGAIPFGYLIVRFKTGRDVREHGSGNIGATNVLRTTGRLAGIVTLALDIVKGIVAVWLMDKFGGPDPYYAWRGGAALAVMAGHAFPVFLQFHGGKAVATFIGAFLYLTPVPLVSVMIVFVVTVAVSRYISLGSIVAAGTFPLGVWLILHPPPPLWIAALIAGAFIVYRHRGNIERIRAGNENVFSLGAKRS
jgi:acyl phosphate:glycerol-3-phosphate acyltransferase